MNSITIALSTDDEKKQPLSPIRIAGPNFEGWALSAHLDKLTARSGANITRRSVLAETMYRYRYQEDGSLLPKLASCFASSVQTLFPGKYFSGLLMVPPPITRADYGPVVTLVTEISRLTGIPLLQFAVRDILDSGNESPKRSDRAFEFSSPETLTIFAGKQILVIDDIYRSGRSLNAFCSLIKTEGRAAEVMALVGTVVVKA
jgi:predicted amidophosphoribosyltransferase